MPHYSFDEPRQLPSLKAGGERPHEHAAFSSLLVQ
jgi:hypothetical protein